VRGVRRDEERVALVQDPELVADEHLEGAVEHEEQLAGAGVQVRRRAVGAVPEQRAVAGEDAAGVLRIEQQRDHAGRVAVEDFGLRCAYQCHVSPVAHPG
jgi:hypothetical protein